MTGTATGQARHLVELGRYAEACALLGPLIAAEPDDGDLHGLMAQALLGSDDPDRALLHANRCVALRPDEEWGHRLASLALGRLGHTVEAVRAAREAVRLAPLDWRTHQALSLAASRVPAHLVEARQAANQAVALAPGAAGAHFAAGLAAQRGRDREAARTAYRRVLAIDPDHAEAVNNLTVLDGHRRLGRAARGYSRSLRLDPHSAVAQHNVELLALRFARRIYLGSLVALVVGIVASATSEGHVTVGTVSVAAATVLALTAYALVLGRAVPPGIRRFVAARVTKDAYLLVNALLAAAMVVVVLVACLVPDGYVVALAVLRPLAVVNIVLAFVSRTRRRAA